MSQGDKARYTDKQKRRARHIEEGYQERGVPEKEASKRAWATVNKVDHGGNQSGSGRGRASDEHPSTQGGHKSSKPSKT